MGEHQPAEGRSTSEVLPLAIVPRLTQLATDLTTWSREHPDAPLVEQEQAVLGLVRGAVLPDLLGAVLPLCTSPSACR